MKSKSKVFAAVRPDTSQCIEASTVPDLANTGETSLSMDCRDKEVLPSVEQSIEDGSRSKKRRKNEEDILEPR